MFSSALLAVGILFSGFANAADTGPALPKENPVETYSNDNKFRIITFSFDDPALFLHPYKVDNSGTTAHDYESDFAKGDSKQVVSVGATLRKCVPQTLNNPNAPPKTYDICGGAISNKTGAYSLDLKGKFTQVQVNLIIPAPVSALGQYLQKEVVVGAESSSAINCSTSLGEVRKSDDNPKYNSILYYPDPSQVPSYASIQIKCDRKIERITVTGTSSTDEDFMLVRSASVTVEDVKVFPLMLSVSPVGGDPNTNAVADGDSIENYFGDKTRLALSANNVVIPATYKLVGKPDLADEVLKNKDALFKDKIALLFGGQSAVNYQDMIFVHRGTQQILVTPQNKDYPPMTLTLISSNPNSLGKESHDCNGVDCDKLIIRYADLIGLPPQYLKGQIRQESPVVKKGSPVQFNLNSYRYEPRTVDRALISSAKVNPNEGTRNKGKDSLVKAYDDFIFKGGDTYVSRSLVSNRSIYFVRENGGVVHIPDDYEDRVVPNQYTPLLASNIMDINNKGGSFTDSKGKTIVVPAQNWDNQNNLRYNTLAIMDQDQLVFKNTKTSVMLSRYNFTAQTVVAASYGLMQVLYTTAVSQAGFVDSKKKGMDPSDLFDPGTNIKIGSTVLLKSIHKMNSAEKNSIDIEKSSTFEVFEKALKNAYWGYNRGNNSKVLDKYPSNSYPDLIVRYSAGYLPK